MTVKQLMEKIVEGSIREFYSLDAEHSAIIKAKTLVHLDSDDVIYFPVAAVFAAVTVFTEDGDVLHNSWEQFDHLYLEKNEEVFESIGELEDSNYYKEAMVKALYKRI